MRGVPQGLFCRIPDCPHPPKAHDLCSMHLSRFERHGDPLIVLKVHEPGRRCAIDGCIGWVLARDWCRTHLQRFYRHGDPLIVRAAGRPRKAA